MTWKIITTAILDCPVQNEVHVTHFRDGAAPNIGDIVKCPYCQKDAVIKVTTVTKRFDKKGVERKL